MLLPQPGSRDGQVRLVVGQGGLVAAQVALVLQVALQAGQTGRARQVGHREDGVGGRGRVGDTTVLLPGF